MTTFEFVLALATGGVLTKLVESIADIIKSGRAEKAKRGRDGAEAKKIEAEAGGVIVKSAGEVIHHYQQIVEQLQKDVESLKRRVAELEDQLKHEQELRRDLETSLAAYQSEEK